MLPQGPLGVLGNRFSCSPPRSQPQVGTVANEGQPSVPQGRNGWPESRLGGQRGASLREALPSTPPNFLPKVFVESACLQGATSESKDEGLPSSSSTQDVFFLGLALHVILRLFCMFVLPLPPVLPYRARVMLRNSRRLLPELPPHAELKLLRWLRQ